MDNSRFSLATDKMPCVRSRYLVNYPMYGSGNAANRASLVGEKEWNMNTRITVTIDRMERVRTEGGHGWTKRRVGTRTAVVELVATDKSLHYLAVRAATNKTRVAVDGGVQAKVISEQNE